MENWQTQIAWAFGSVVFKMHVLYPDFAILQMIMDSRSKLRSAFVYFISKQGPGDRLNIKMSYFQYKDSHVKDKTVSRPPYL